ncbi:Rab1a [Hexamita inflata]|uniref:Rab1a n=1 Tax=Hexamita inflata TaxID=28002 RepID=A0AA86NCE0_9EUKA|nr:Rab1a [Hexamita inflata]
MKRQIVLLGDTAVGKTSLVRQFTSQDFDQLSTTSLSASCVNMIYDDQKFEIWDTAGQERYSAITPIYYKKAQLIVIVFDVVHTYSFDRAKFWYEQVRKTTQIPVFVVGNMIDLKQKVNKTDVQFFVDANKLLYFETSAKTGEGVQNLLQKAFQFANFSDQKVESKKKTSCCW